MLPVKPWRRCWAAGVGERVQGPRLPEPLQKEDEDGSGGD